MQLCYLLWIKFLLLILSSIKLIGREIEGLDSCWMLNSLLHGTLGSTRDIECLCLTYVSFLPVWSYVKCLGISCEVLYGICVDGVKVWRKLGVVLWKFCRDTDCSST